MLSIEGNFGRTLPTGSASQSNIYDRLFSSPLRGDLLLLLLLLLFLKEKIRIRGFFQYCSRFGRNSCAHLNSLSLFRDKEISWGRGRKKWRKLRDLTHPFVHIWLDS